MENLNEQTTVKLPIETKKQVRMVAAELNTTMGNAALKLITIGLAEFQKTSNTPLYAERGHAPMGAVLTGEAL